MDALGMVEVRVLLSATLNIYMIRIHYVWIRTTEENYAYAHIMGRSSNQEWSLYVDYDRRCLKRRTSYSPEIQVVGEGQGLMQ